jgi:hypothetical protein
MGLGDRELEHRAGAEKKSSDERWMMSENQAKDNLIQSSTVRPDV